MALLSQESAKRHYDNLLESYNYGGKFASKVVTFQHDLEHDILYEITGCQKFVDQRRWLKENQKRINNGKKTGGSIPPEIVSDIVNLKTWRNVAEHENKMTPVRYLAHFETMAETIRFFSEIPYPAEIQNIMDNQPQKNRSNGDVQNAKGTEEKPAAPVAAPSVQGVTPAPKQKPMAKPPETEKKKENAGAEYKISFGYKITGPFTIKEIVQKIQSGEVTREWYICPPGQPEKSQWPKIDAIKNADINAALTQVKAKNHKKISETKPQQTPKQFTYILRCNGIETPPCSWEEVKQKISRGEINRDYYIYQTGSNTEIGAKIDSMSELAHCFEQFEKHQAEEFRKQAKENQRRRDEEEARKKAAEEQKRREREDQKPINKIKHGLKKWGEEIFGPPPDDDDFDDDDFGDDDDDFGDDEEDDDYDFDEDDDDWDDEEDDDDLDDDDDYEYDEDDD
ncbi:MAG: DUF4670 domain-containing protein [Spirochaetaceae bacterium]|nr:DUF4670 domain-containing protein [Spirochaetaceae bacterium]